MKRNRSKAPENLQIVCRELEEPEDMKGSLTAFWVSLEDLNWELLPTISLKQPD